MTDIDSLYRMHDSDDFENEFMKQAADIRDEPVGDKNGFVIPGFRMNFKSAYIILIIKCVFFLMKKVYYLEQSIRGTNEIKR